MDTPPRLGFGAGTAWYGGKLGDAAMEAAIHGALSAGFRHLDLAGAHCAVSFKNVPLHHE
jgi:hypothetical protein